MNTHSEPCPLCGRIGCASIQMSQPGRPIDVIGTRWRLDCLERQFADLRKQVEALRTPVVQPGRKPATGGDKADTVELAQWRKALVWRPLFHDREDCWLLKAGTFDNITVGIAKVHMDDAGKWFVELCVDKRPVPRRDASPLERTSFTARNAAMRAAESKLGLPKCRVEGEP